MIFFKSSTDFFGPAADALQCNLMQMGGAPVVHLIPGCAENLVKGIHALALEIVKAQGSVAWQRRDGSINYEKLPTALKVWLKADDLDAKGYINLAKLHIVKPESLYQNSAAQRGNSLVNQCGVCRKEVDSVMTCAALTYRLAAGKAFDVRDYSFDPEVRKVDLRGDKRTDLSLRNDVISGEFRTLWNRAVVIQARRGSFPAYAAFKTAMADVREKAQDVKDKKVGAEGTFWKAIKTETEKRNDLIEEMEAFEEAREANAFGTRCLTFLQGLIPQNRQPSYRSGLSTQSVGSKGYTLACSLILLCLFFSQSLFGANDQSRWVLSHLSEMGSLFFSKNAYIDMASEWIGKAPVQLGAVKATTLLHG